MPGQRPDDRLRIVGIAGSLRAGSFNRMLLKATVELAPDNLHIEPFDLAVIPLYNADADTEDGRPAGVRALKEAVAAADGLLIASPEYNHSVPGVLQNAIDWVSRPALRSPLTGKPVAIMGASISPVGTARGQQILKLTLMSSLALVMPHPGVLVSSANDKFSDGVLTHEPTREFLVPFLTQLADWIARTT